MDNSSVFRAMIDGAIAEHPDDFANFDTTKNVQDQLQEMVEIGKLEKYWIKTGVETLETLIAGGYLVESRLLRFYDFVIMGECRLTDRRTEYCLQFTSMEQLWLSFVMCELHQKKWDGEKWMPC